MVSVASKCGLMGVSVHGAQGARHAMDGGHGMRPDPGEEQCVKEIVTLELAIMAIENLMMMSIWKFLG